MIRLVLLASLVGALASPALAQRAQTPTMSCGQVHRVLAAQGAAVLGTGGQTYDRFVADIRFCLPMQSVKQTLVPTREGACPVFTCYDPSGERFLDD